MRQENLDYLTGSARWTAAAAASWWRKPVGRGDKNITDQSEPPMDEHTTPCGSKQWQSPTGLFVAEPASLAGCGWRGWGGAEEQTEGLCLCDTLRGPSHSHIGPSQSGGLPGPSRPSMEALFGTHSRTHTQSCLLHRSVWDQCRNVAVNTHRLTNNKGV